MVGEWEWLEKGRRGRGGISMASEFALLEGCSGVRAWAGRIE